MADTKTSYQSSIQVWRHYFSLFLFGKVEEKEGWSAFNWNWEKIYRTLACFTYLKTYPWGLLVYEQAECLLVSIEHPWLLLSACECLQGSVNNPWTPNECTWVALSEYEQHLNTIEYAWMPLSEYEHPLSVCECHWVILNATHYCVTMQKTSLCETWTVPECDWVHMNAFDWVLPPPESYWVCMNAFKWVLNMPWMLLSVHEPLSVSVNSPLSACECLWVRSI